MGRGGQPALALRLEHAIRRESGSLEPNLEQSRLVLEIIEEIRAERRRRLGMT